MEFALAVEALIGESGLRRRMRVAGAGAFRMAFRRLK